MAKKIIALIDFANIAYNILYRYEHTILNGSYSEVENRVNAELAYVNSRVWIASKMPIAVLWTFDSKPYWRSIYEPEYKATRQYRAISQYLYPMKDFIRSSYSYLESEGFEADDLVSSIVRHYPENNYLLVSSDSDWQGLLTYEDRVRILNPFFEPKLRGLVASYAWLMGKHTKASKYCQFRFPMPTLLDYDPKQIWDWKVVEGDAIDNLKPGTNLGLISLIEPLYEPPKTDPKLIETLEYYEYSKEVLAQFNRQGINTLDPIVVRDFDDC